jgi:hypothetical protein
MTERPEEQVLVALNSFEAGSILGMRQADVPDLDQRDPAAVAQVAQETQDPLFGRVKGRGRFHPGHRGHSYQRSQSMQWLQEWALRQTPQAQAVSRPA